MRYVVSLLSIYFISCSASFSVVLRVISYYIGSCNNGIGLYCSKYNPLSIFKSRARYNVKIHNILKTNILVLVVLHMYSIDFICCENVILWSIISVHGSQTTIFVLYNWKMFGSKPKRSIQSGQQIPLCAILWYSQFLLIIRVSKDYHHRDI